jgi:hypothetical protein
MCGTFFGQMWANAVRKIEKIPRQKLSLLLVCVSLAFWAVVLIASGTV